jgi:hypothetical protein
MSKVQQMNTQQIQAILLAAQAQQIDLSSAEAIKAFTEGLTAKPAVIAKEAVAKEEIAEGDLCKARVWSGKTGTVAGSGNNRCGKKHINGTFCKKHQADYDECAHPCSMDENGKHIGLYCGRIDEEIPYKNAEGEIVIVWNNDSIKAKIAEDLANGAVYNKHTTEGHKANGTKKVPTVTRVRKAKADAPSAEAASEVPAVKGKKGKKTAVKDPNAPKKAQNAYFFFTAEKRAEVKAKLLADFLAENPTADEKSQKAAVAIGRVAQAIGQLYKELSDESKATYKQLEEADKLRYKTELEAYNAGKALSEIAEEQEETEDSASEAGEETQAQTSDENTISADEIQIDGVDYLYDSNTGTIYDLDCNELGKLVDGKIVN